MHVVRRRKPRIRLEAARTVDRIAALTSAPPVLLTGDNQRAAARLAVQAGVNDAPAMAAASTSATMGRDLAGHLPLAVLGHEGSTVIVGLNGLRLLPARTWAKATR